MNMNYSTSLCIFFFFAHEQDDDEWIEILEENSEASNNKPSPRYGHSAISYQEQVFIFGGQGESHNPTRYDNPSIPALICWNDMYIYNSKLQSWSEIVVTNNTENIPSPRNSHSAVILDNPSLSEPNAKMIIFGGANELIGPNNECWQFDLTAKTWERLHCIGDENFGFPDAREMHTACIVNYCQTVIPGGDIEPNKTGFENIHKIEMIVMGGRKESGEICKDCWSLNLVTLRWRRLPDPPTPRCSHTAQFVPRTEGCKMYPIIYFFGGWDGSSTIFDSFLQYDIFEQSWSCSAYVNMAKRFAHVSCMNESCDKMYIFGGINREKELSSLLEVTFPHVTLDERKSQRWHM